MPTSTNVTNLKINTLTKAQYDTAVQGGVIGPNELSVITDLDEAIQVATLPTASAGEAGKIYQFVGATDASYTNGYFYKCVSDGGNPATYSWTRVDVQPTPSGLPDQTGQSGKFLTTNGTDASWGSALVNNTTNSNSLSIQGSIVGTGAGNTAIQGTISSGNAACSVAIGQGSSVWSHYCVAVGYSSFADYYAVAIGCNASANATNATAIGYGAIVTARNAIQLGTGDRGTVTNADANTFKVANGNGNYEMMSANGTIPADRLPNAINKYSTMPNADDCVDWIVQYTGTTDSSYTHGYIYQSEPTGAELTSGVCTVDGDTFQGGNDVEDLPAPTFTLNLTTLQAYLQTRSKPAIVDSAASIMVEYNQYNNYVVWLNYNDDGDTHDSVEVVTSGDSISDISGALTTLGFTVDLDGFTWLSWVDMVLPENDIYSWERIDVQPAPVIPDPLPSQTGNAGKFLTTDGTDASWGSVLWNQASSSSQSFGNFLWGNTNYKNVNTGSYSNILFIGGPTSPTNTAYWQPNYAQIYIGSGGRISGHSAICLGGATIAKGTGSIAIGGFAEVQANYAIQLNTAASSRSNTDAGTFKIGNNNGNFEIMSADGTIPEARLADTTNAAQGQVLTLDGNNNAVWQTPSTAVTSTTATLVAANWSSSTQTITVNGVTSSNVVIVSPQPLSSGDYATAGVLCTAQNTNSLTFTCTQTPSNAIDLSIVIIG